MSERTLTDEFAMAALTGLLSDRAVLSEIVKASPDNDGLRVALPSICYGIAQGMVAEKNRLAVPYEKPSGLGSLVRAARHPAAGSQHPCSAPPPPKISPADLDHGGPLRRPRSDALQRDEHGVTKGMRDYLARTRRPAR